MEIKVFTEFSHRLARKVEPSANQTQIPIKLCKCNFLNPLLLSGFTWQNPVVKLQRCCKLALYWIFNSQFGCGIISGLFTAVSTSLACLLSCPLPTLWYCTHFI
ncbi:hypothetical protein BYT27DRAFT_6687213 [Phlegmacium glaucopus]|nr:hypothetical protein BYT27DRAFT_6687213 [Phlegmacium glaucopus]